MAIGTPQTLGHGSSLAASTVTITTTNNIVAGDLLVCAVATLKTGGAVTVSSISDGTNTYAKAVSGTQNAGNEDCEIWFIASAAAVGSGATITVTLSGAATAADAVACRVTGAAVKDKTATNGAATNPVSTSTGVLTIANEIVFGVGASAFGAGSTQTYTESSGFTSLDHTATASGIYLDLSYDTVAATTSVTYNPTWSATGDITIVCVASFEVLVVNATLNATAGSYTLTGKAANLGRLFSLSLAAGSYALTGAAATFKKVMHISATAGSYAITGAAATLGKGLHMAALAGSYALTGKAIIGKLTWHMTATAGSYAITGKAMVQDFVAGAANLIRKTKFVLQKLRTTAPKLDQ